MKSTIKDTSKSKYPWIGIYEELGIIVLFVGPEKGVQLHYSKGKLGGNLEIGEYSDSIAEDVFRYYNGEVTLSN